MRRLVRMLGLAAVAAAAAGCTTVKVSQRDGCWVRETHRTLHGTIQDVGPCVRPPPKWSEDRLTRLVQECVAQADYRWQVRAVAAWSRREPPPPQDAQETVIKICMNEAATGVVTQNETLQQRLADVSSDREAFRSEAAQGSQHLRASADRLAEYLGEAAKRPPPVATATATATSDGTATTETGLQADSAAAGTLPASAGTAPPVLAATAPPTGAPPAAAPPAPSTPAAAAPTASDDPKVETAAGQGPGSATDTQAKRLAAAKAARKRALARAARRAGCDVPAPAPGATEAVACPPVHGSAPEPGPSR